MLFRAHLVIFRSPIVHLSTFRRLFSRRNLMTNFIYSSYTLLFFVLKKSCTDFFFIFLHFSKKKNWLDSNIVHKQRLILQHVLQGAGEGFYCVAAEGLSLKFEINKNKNKNCFALGHWNNWSRISGTCNRVEAEKKLWICTCQCGICSDLMVNYWYFINNSEETVVLFWASSLFSKQ